MSKVACIFSGQGSQYIGMNNIFNNYQSYLEKYFKISKEVLGYDIYEIVSEGPLDKLNNTKYTQPAIFIISAIAYNIYKDNFKLPNYCAGHSLGEITALYAAKVLDFRNALSLVKKRAENMQNASIANPGKMLAIINQDNQTINRIIKHNSVIIANENSPKQIILSGDVESINKTIDYCKKNRIRTLLLPVSGAFHSSLMQSASDALLETINHLNFKDAIMPIYQNYTALPAQDKDEIRNYLVKQITSPVKWEKIIRNMIKDDVSYFIEIGPKKILTNLNQSINSKLKNESFEELINEK